MLDWESHKGAIFDVNEILEVNFTEAKSLRADFAFSFPNCKNQFGGALPDVVAPSPDRDLLATTLENKHSLRHLELGHSTRDNDVVEVLVDLLDLVPLLRGKELHDCRH